MTRLRTIVSALIVAVAMCVADNLATVLRFKVKLQFVDPI